MLLDKRVEGGHGIPYEGNYSSWLAQKKTRLAQEEKTESARQRTLERELEWVRLAPRARQAKNKARVQKYEEMAAQETAERILQHEIVIPPPPRLGNDVVTAREQDSVLDLLELMRRRKVRRVPVTGAQGQLIGIVAADDILAVVAQQLQALAAAVGAAQRREV